MGKDGVHPGTAYTLVTSKQASFAADLVFHLEVGFGGRLGWGGGGYSQVATGVVFLG